MKFVLAAVLCTLAVKTVITMPVAEPGIQSDQLTVVPLEKITPVLPSEHVLRRETPETAAPTLSEHREGETAEEHAKHSHLAARLDDKAEKPEPIKVEETKPLAEDVKIAEKKSNLQEKKDDDLLKGAEAVVAAKAAAADIITPAETLAPVPALPAVPTPIDSKPETPLAEGKNALAKEINSELKEEKSPKAVEKIEQSQLLAKSSPIVSEPAASAVAEPIAPVAAVTEAEASKEEKKIEAVVTESQTKTVEEPKDEMKKVEDKTDRVTRGTEEAASLNAAKYAGASSAPAPASTDEVSAAVAETEAKLTVEKKEEEIKLPEKKIEAVEIGEISKVEKTPELAKAAEQNPIVEASVVAASAGAADNLKKTEKSDDLSETKVAEPSLQAKRSSVSLETQPEVQPSEVAAAPTEIKPVPVGDSIKAKLEPIEASKESVEAVKAEDSSSSEEKSSEEDQSGEKLGKSVAVKSIDPKKDESKAEELPKPQEVKGQKKPE